MSGEQIARAFLAGVLNSMWVALALAIAAWTISKFLPRTNAATRYLLWWAVLALIAMLPFRGLERGVNRSRPMAIPMVAERIIPIGEATFTPAIPAARSPFPLRIRAGNWPRIAAAIWLLVCLMHICRIAWSFLYLSRVKGRSLPAPAALRETFASWVKSCGIRRPVRLLVSRQIASPMAVGFLRPAVILPEPLLTQFKERELDHVLLHELAHVARRDDWTNLAARCLAAVVGLHPVAAWVLRRVARERELACDDWVVSRTGEARPYAASLARLFELCGRRRHMVLAAGMAGSSSHLGERIEILLDRGRQFTSRASVARVALTATVLLALVAAGARAPRWIVLAQPAPVSPVRFQGPGQPTKPHGSFLAALVAAGYGDLSVDDIISLKSRGVTADFLTGISHSGWGRMSAEDLIALSSHGVRPEAFAEIHALGFGPYTPAQAIDLTSHGVGPGIFRALRDAGFAHVEPGDVVGAVSRGVRPDTLREAERYGSHLTLQQIVKLKMAGVLP